MVSRPEPITLPRCIFRSFAPNAVGLSSPGLPGDVETNVVRQSLGCGGQLGYAIPPSLLHDLLLHDSLAPAARSSVSGSTVLALSHGSEELLVHCDGDDLSTLVLRPVSSLLRNYVFSSPGFSLSNESPVLALFQSGGASWTQDAFFTAQSAYELRQYRSVDVSDYLPSAEEQLSEEDRQSLFVIEPLLRTRFPELIAASSANAFETFVLGSSGRLFYWSSGVVSEHSGGSLFGVLGEPRCQRVAATLHPMTALVSRDQALLLADRRAERPTKLFSLEYDIAALKQQPSSPHRAYVAFHSTMALFDVRYTASFLETHPTAGTHCFLGESFPSETGRPSPSLSLSRNGLRPVHRLRLLFQAGPLSLGALLRQGHTLLPSQTPGRVDPWEFTASGLCKPCEFSHHLTSVTG